MAAATRNPSTATTVAEGAHSEPDVPRAVTTIASPRTMSVNSARRSGILLRNAVSPPTACAPAADAQLPGEGNPQRTYRAGEGNARDAIQIPIAIEYCHA